jgi:hypothetical protein
VGQAVGLAGGAAGRADLGAIAIGQVARTPDRDVGPVAFEMVGNVVRLHGADRSDGVYAIPCDRPESARTGGDVEGRRHGSCLRRRTDPHVDRKLPLVRLLS